MTLIFQLHKLKVRKSLRIPDAHFAGFRVPVFQNVLIAVFAMWIKHFITIRDVMFTASAQLVMIFCVQSNVISVGLEI